MLSLDTKFDTLAGVLHLLTGKIRPLIQAQITLPVRVKQNQLQHLNNLLGKLEDAISIKVKHFLLVCSALFLFRALLDPRAAQTWKTGSHHRRN